METKLPPPAPEDGPICGVTHTVGPHDEFGFYTCTASRGHVGDHVAYGPDPGNEVHHTWPQTGEERCGADRHGYGYSCRLVRGHEGDHRFVSPTSGVVSTWPQTGSPDAPVRLADDVTGAGVAKFEPESAIDLARKIKAKKDQPPDVAAGVDPLAIPPNRIGAEAGAAGLPPPAPEDGPVCGKTAAAASWVKDDAGFGVWTCTAGRSHAGNHVAYGPDGEVHHTWPARAPGIDLGDDPDGDAS
jgi:hypothetical protein